MKRTNYYLLPLFAVGMSIACTDDATSRDDEIGDSGTSAESGESDVATESGSGSGDTTTETTESGESESGESESSESESSESTTDTTSEDTTEAETGESSPLDDIPEEEWEPVPNPDGVPSPQPGVYDDIGVADPNDGFRALIGLDLVDREGLVDFVTEVSDPTSDIYGQYMDVDELFAAHSPSEYDFTLLQAWLDFSGFSVNYLATNRMLIQFSGTVGQFNEAFSTTLHVCMRKNPQAGNPPVPVYCTPDPMTLPIFVANRSPGIVTADLPAEVGNLPNEVGEIFAQPPNGASTGSRLTPERVWRAYDIDDLHALGFDGSGQKIGVIMGATIHYKWAQSFWQSFGIVRTNPEVKYLMEPPITRYVEAQLDNIWAGAMAPGAEMVSYSGPDSRNTSMVYVYNEAITQAPKDDVWVLTDSFAHREDSEPQVVRNQYNDSSLFGAALGLTLLAASGDSAQTDTPSSSEYVTGVGGTRLHLDAQGAVTDETAWDLSGSGITITFPMPDWQVAVAGDISDKRVVADVSAAASPWSPYWVYYNSTWSLYGGTSFSSPVWAGMLVIVNQYRLAKGMSRVGYMNPTLYTVPEVQATFRDITVGATQFHPATPSWDPVTGWGAPHALSFAQAYPG